MKLIDYIKRLFDSDTVITTADGQKAITLEGITPEIDGGLELFESPVPDDKDDVVQVKAEESALQVLDGKIADVLARLEILEKAIILVDDLEPSDDAEVW